MSVKNPKILRKCLENLQPQMPELEVLKKLIFPLKVTKLSVVFLISNFFLSSSLMVVRVLTYISENGVYCYC